MKHQSLSPPQRQQFLRLRHRHLHQHQNKPNPPLMAVTKTPEEMVVMTQLGWLDQVVLREPTG
jgi:hypothetical protein